MTNSERTALSLPDFCLNHCCIKRGDTVGELKSADICGAHMPSLKAKKLGKLAQEKVLLEL
jgi:hypothetical protein